MKPLRFLPLVAFATFALLVLKLAGLLLDGGSMLTGTQQTQARNAAQGEKDKVAAVESGEKAPDGGADGKGAGKPGDKAAETSGEKADAKGGKKGDGAVPVRANRGPPKDVESVISGEHRTKGEVALLESLAQRRGLIEAREKELDLRMNLLKAAEQRVEERIGVLKDLQGKVASMARKDEEDRGEQYKRLVAMYSSMKPKDAARIFDGLDNTILLGLMKEMKMQTMSAILAAMNPDKTRELTISIAGEAKQKMTDNSLDELPRIGAQKDFAR